MDFPAYFRRHLARICLSMAVLVLFLLHAGGVIELGFVQRLENYAYDLRLNLTMPGTQDKRIVIVDIDEKSLQRQGQWPWGRDKLAALVDQLFDRYHIDVLGFDVVFAERDGSSGLRSLEKLGSTELRHDAQFQDLLDRLRPQLDFDHVFAESLKGRRVVLGYYFNRGEAVARDDWRLPPPTFVEGSFKGKNIDFYHYSGFGANLAPLQQNAATAGHFNPEPDVDGLTRRIAMLVEHDGALYEPLSLAMARMALGVPRIEAGYATLGVGRRYSGLEWLKLGNRRIPVDERVAALVPYRGEQGSFPYVSATDVLEGRVPEDVLKGAIVLVGATAPGLMDLRATPVQSVFPGVEIHANMISGILDQGIKERPAYTQGAEFVLLLLAGLLLALLLPRLSALWTSVAAAAALLVLAAFNLAIWQAANLVLPIASLLLMVTVMFVLNMSYGFFVESRGKRQLAGKFGQYVPPELVDEMVDVGPENFSMEGENREMTVLFSDVRGFTSISEGLDPKQLTRLMNEFLTPMTQVIHQHRGTIDKYMGDAIMAFWGAPLRDADHARHALEAALDMMEGLNRLREDFLAKGWPPVNIGIGINSGPMTVGNMGSRFRMAYTVMGDAVNLGSRLEGLTKEYGVNIVVSQFTRDKVADFVFRELDHVRVKGKDKPVAIFEPVCPASQEDKATRDELKLYREALRLYRAQNWDLAELQFLNLQKLNPRRYLYKMYAERVAYFRANPPGDGWDGVFTFKTK